MEEVKKKLSFGEFKAIQNEGKSTVWKYLHTVDSPSFCIVLNSPDDSFFLTFSMKAVILNVMYFILKNELLHLVKHTR